MFIRLINKSRRFYFNYLHYNDRRAIWHSIKSFFYKLLRIKDVSSKTTLPYIPGETSKAKPRREKEGFFQKYCQGQGLDIGCGGDILAANCQGWDFADGNAQYLKGLPNEAYDFVYSSHSLEHMRDPAVALKNWWRVLKPNGYLIIYLPERELYEMRKTLPSHRNPDHKRFFLLDKNDPPDTIGLIPLIKEILSGQQIIYAKPCGDNGEFSIEAVVKKLPKHLC
ncbi:MAG: methyltransferase domain-containing protein [bacterium]